MQALHHEHNETMKQSICVCVCVCAIFIHTYVINIPVFVYAAKFFQVLTNFSIWHTGHACCEFDNITHKTIARTQQNNTNKIFRCLRTKSFQADANQ
jgi:hypothetical protein